MFLEGVECGREGVRREACGGPWVNAEGWEHVVVSVGEGEYFGPVIGGGAGGDDGGGALFSSELEVRVRVRHGGGVCVDVTERLWRRNVVGRNVVGGRLGLLHSILRWKPSRSGRAWYFAGRSVSWVSLW